MISGGWVGYSWEALPNGQRLYRYNYFEIKRNYAFVWMTLIGIAYLANGLKRRWLGQYGLVEVIFGVVGGYVAVDKLPLDEATAWITIFASAYVVVRGATNISQAVRDSEAATPSPASESVQKGLGHL